MTASAPFSSPRRRIIGFAPAARFLSPSFTMACARTVAVVVPSPATSLVLVATSLSSCAPMFSKGSGRSISRAIVTPSLVIVGAPNFLSSTTLRPFGPSVTLTASASASIPFLREWRACSSNCSLFATKHTPKKNHISSSGLNQFKGPETHNNKHKGNPGRVTRQYPLCRFRAGSNTPRYPF